MMNTSGKAWTSNILPLTFLLQYNSSDHSFFSLGNLTWKPKPTQLALLFKLKLLLNKAHDWWKNQWLLMMVLTPWYYLHQVVWHATIWNMTLMVLANWIEDELTVPNFCTSHNKVIRIPIYLNYRSISIFSFGENSPFYITFLLLLNFYFIINVR